MRIKTAQPLSAEAVKQLSQWFASELGQMLLAQELPLMEHALAETFGRCWLHYGFPQNTLVKAGQISQRVRLGPLPEWIDVRCAENAWPVTEHAVDVVVLQHGLDFAHCPHALLREAAHAVRPGGHLLVVGFNPWSAWGLRSVLTSKGLGRARLISAARVADWLSVLGFALEQRSFGCYRPPLVAGAGSARLAWCERFGRRTQLPVGGVYCLLARKMLAGVRPLKLARRNTINPLLPMPVATASGHPVQSKSSAHE